MGTLLCETSCGCNSHHAGSLVKNRDIIKQLGLPQRTVWENLDDAKQDWAVYFNDFPSTLLFRYTWGHLDKFHGWDKFLDDASEGKLPQYTWLEPRYYDDFGKAAQGGEEPCMWSDRVRMCTDVTHGLLP